MLSPPLHSGHLHLFQQPPPSPPPSPSYHFKHHPLTTTSSSSSSLFNLFSLTPFEAQLPHNNYSQESDDNDTDINSQFKNPSQLSEVTCSYNDTCTQELASLLQSCTNARQVNEVHAVVIKYDKYLISTYVFNNLMCGYVKFGKLTEAREVFDVMNDRNVVTWTAMFNGYLKFGLEDEALSLFKEFVEEGFYGNAKTFVCMLNLCRGSGNFMLGKGVHGMVVKSRFDGGLILDSEIMQFYAQCGDLDGAFRVFDRMEERDVVCWTTMITACSQLGRGIEALRMFLEMLREGAEPNEFTVCSVLNACGEDEELRFGRQLHGAIIKNKYRMDVYVGTSLIDMYAKCGEIEDARLVFDGMRWRNTVTWTSMIAGYARNGIGEAAIRLFRLMKRRKIYTNSLTIVSILRACGLLKALPTGKELHAQIIKGNVQSNIYIASALVWLYCKCREYSTASNILQDMSFRDVVSWTAMISCCADLGHEYEALGYLKEMLGEGVDPNSFTYSSALKACAELEDINQGKLIHTSINKSPTLPNVFVGSALINMYARCGHLSDAIRVFDNMPERNLVSWKSMVVAYAKNGLCAEAFKLVYRMQAEGMELDDYIISTVLTACGEFEWNKKSDEHTSQHWLQS